MRVNSILRRIVAMLMLCVALAGFAESVKIGELYYILDESKLTAGVTYKDSGRKNKDYVSGEVVIPSSVKYNDVDYKVTQIRNWAFEYCTISKLVIPESIERFGDNSFYIVESVEYNAENITLWSSPFRSYQLKSATFGSSVKNIPANLFSGCTALTSVILPDSLETIGGNAFSRCTGLFEISLPQNLKKIHHEAFSGTSIKEVVIPENVTTIGEGAFNTVESVVFNAVNRFISESYLTPFSNIKTAVFGESVKYISNNLFSGCTALTDVTFPESIETIGKSAFKGCTALTEITLPESVKTIERDAFEDCTALTEVSLPESLESIRTGAFYNCPIKKIIIPQGVTKIDSGTFNSVEAVEFTSENCLSFTRGYPFSANLKSVTFRPGIENIPNDLFINSTDNCSGLSEVNLPDGIKTIGNNAFSKCPIENLVIPSSITFIGKDAFSGTKSVEYNCLNYEYSENTSYSYSPFSAELKTATFGNSVKYIPKSMFSGCTGLTEISLPNKLDSIGANAFEGCENLKSIVFPETMKKIGRSAFYGCSLTEVRIPAGVTFIGRKAFDGCANLTKVEYNAVNCQDDSRSPANLGWIVGGNFEPWTPFPQDNITEFIIGDGVEIIPSHLFYHCSWLKTITIPNSVKEIGYEAFAGCTNLDSLTLHDSITKIGSYAFSKCENLKSITLPKSITSIEQALFKNCRSLTSITIPESVTVINNAFPGCDNLETVYFNAHNCQKADDNITDYSPSTKFTFFDNVKEVVVGDSVRHIPGLFYNCEELRSVTLGESVETIADRAFSGCKKLSSIDFPNSLEKIEERAFYNCLSLTEITIPENVKTLGSSIFSGCENIKTVYYNARNAVLPLDYNASFSCNPDSLFIGDSVISLPNSLISGANNLTYVSIGKSVESIGDDTFSGCESLRSIEFNDPLLSIGKRAFYNCSNLANVAFNESLTTIGEKAFYNCSNLTNVAFNESLTTIGKEAFCNCISLTEITIPENVTNIGSNAFRNTALSTVNYNAKDCSNCCQFPKLVTTLNIGDKVTFIPNAFSNISCREIVFSDSVEIIADEAFKNCSNLTKVTFGKNMWRINDKAFSECDNLVEIYSRAIFPPTAQAGSFSSNSYILATLYVPNAGLKLYTSTMP